MSLLWQKCVPRFLFATRKHTHRLKFKPSVMPGNTFVSFAIGSVAKKIARVPNISVFFWFVVLSVKHCRQRTFIKQIWNHAWKFLGLSRIRIQDSKISEPDSFNFLVGAASSVNMDWGAHCSPSCLSMNPVVGRLQHISQRSNKLVQIFFPQPEQWTQDEKFFFVCLDLQPT